MTIICLNHTSEVQQPDNGDVDQQDQERRQRFVQVSSESSKVLGPAEAQEWRWIQLLQTSEHNSWAGKEDDEDETDYE